LSINFSLSLSLSLSPPVIPTSVSVGGAHSTSSNAGPSCDPLGGCPRCVHSVDRRLAMLYEEEDTCCHMRRRRRIYAVICGCAQRGP